MGGMRGSIRLFSVFGIAIKIHITFLLLALVVFPGGLKSLALVIGVFFFVTTHELCHSLVARRFGLQVREITLFPIGGVASMSGIPERPIHELLIAIAGPLSNIAVLAAFFYPMRSLLGDAILFHPLSIETWPLTAGYIYWINLVLAAFNMIPAFPMDGGRILRAALATRLGWIKATKIAVNLGHIFALVFVYFGVTRGSLMLVVIAVFIYMAASSEEAQVAAKETLKKLKIHDILTSDFSVTEHDPDEYPEKDKKLLGHKKGTHE